MDKCFLRLLRLLVITVSVLTVFILSASAESALPEKITAVTTAPEGYTAINTASELASISDLSGSYILLSDIDLASSSISAIGSESDPFTGVFDGNGHKITGLKLTSSSDHTALFAACDSAEIKNLIIENANINVNDSSAAYVYSSAICAYADNSYISNCYVSADIEVASIGLTYASGICAYADNTAIENVVSTASVSAVTTDTEVYVGGITGYMLAGASVDSAINSGTLTASSADEVYVGGIAGGTKRDLNDSSGNKPSISNSRNIADISVSETKSSISINCSGIAAEAQNLAVTSCINTGNITVEAPLGATASGICGYYSRNTLSECANLGNLSATSTKADAFAGGITGETIVGTITNCYNTGSIYAKGTQSTNSGGISAYCTMADKFSNCYSVGVLLSEASTSAGTLIGSAAYDDTRTTLYALADETHPAIGNKTDSSVTLLTSDEMKNSSSFTSFDFDSVWYMPSSGDYSYPMLSSLIEKEDEVTVVYGDVDGNGVLDAIDSVTLSRNLAGWNGYETINTANADVDANGIIDAIDSVALSRNLAGWSGYETLPLAN